MVAKTTDSRGESMTQTASAGMEHWETSKYGIDLDDGKSDGEKYPPPASAPPGVFTSPPEDETLGSDTAEAVTGA